MVGISDAPRRSRSALLAMAAGTVLALLATVASPAGALGDDSADAANRPRPGSLDTSFGAGGTVLTDHDGAVDGARDVLVQPDGKVVAAGAWGLTDGDTSSWDFGVARYDQRGRLDPTFGDGGKVATDFLGGEDAINAVLHQRDGALVAVGSAFPTTGSNPVFALARYRPDGSLDPAFGEGGTLTTDVGDHGIATSAALQRDGRIVVAGYAVAADQSRSDVVVARYTSDGTLDPTFGDGGIVTTPFGGTEQSFAQGHDMAIQPDGKIVVAGLAAVPGTADFGVIRFRPTGSLDRRFGDGGFAAVSFSEGSFEEAVALALLPGGGISLVGSAAGTWGLALLRHDGTLDARFGDGGTVVSGFAGLGGEARDIVAQPDGKLVVVGRMVPGGEHFDAMVVRYRGDGRLDRRFGNDGVVTTDIDRRTDEAIAVTLGHRGAIVTAGTSEPNPYTGTGADFLLARYHG